MHCGLEQKLNEFDGAVFVGLRLEKSFIVLTMRTKKKSEIFSHNIQISSRLKNICVVQHYFVVYND